MRPTKDEYLMSLARVAATRTTCIRRGVGCVLADAEGRVLAIGYNGVAAGLPHCNEELRLPNSVSWKRGLVDEVSHPHACQGHDLPSGQDQCEAVHAEQNAVVQCRDVSRVRTAYVTLSPCKACLKLLLNTGCQELVVGEVHVDPWPLKLWEQAGWTWRMLPDKEAK